MGIKGLLHGPGSVLFTRLLHGPGSVLFTWPFEIVQQEDKAFFEDLRHESQDIHSRVFLHVAAKGGVYADEIKGLLPEGVRKAGENAHALRLPEGNHFPSKQDNVRP